MSVDDDVDDDGGGAPLHDAVSVTSSRVGGALSG